MIRNKKQQDAIIIDLTGPNGNAFALLALARRLSMKTGLDFDVVKEEMVSSDYENLIETFDKYFGDFVILER